VGCILAPLRGFFRSLAAHPRLTPWAAFLRRFAACSAPGGAPTAYAEGCILAPLRGLFRSRRRTHGLRRGLHSCAASRLVPLPAAHPRLTPRAAFLRRFAACSAPGGAPTAYVVGCILAPLRRFFRSLAAYPQLVNLLASDHHPLTAGHH